MKNASRSRDKLLILVPSGNLTLNWFNKNKKIQVINMN